VGFSECDKVINVKVTRVRERAACVRVKPQTAFNATLAGIFVLDGYLTGSDQHFLARVLTVSVLIYPVSPVSPVVFFWR
jgi:hypothetical protein